MPLPLASVRFIPISALKGLASSSPRARAERDCARSWRSRLSISTFCFSSTKPAFCSSSPRYETVTSRDLRPAASGGAVMEEGMLLLPLHDMNVPDDLAVGLLERAGHLVGGAGEGPGRAAAVLVHHDADDCLRCRIDMKIERRAHGLILAVDDLSRIHRDDVGGFASRNPIRRGLVVTGGTDGGADRRTDPMADKRLARIGGGEEKESGKRERCSHKDGIVVIGLICVICG